MEAPARCERNFCSEPAAPFALISSFMGRMRPIQINYCENHLHYALEIIQNRREWHRTSAGQIEESDDPAGAILSYLRMRGDRMEQLGILLDAIRRTRASAEKVAYLLGIRKETVIVEKIIEKPTVIERLVYVGSPPEAGSGLPDSWQTRGITLHLIGLSSAGLQEWIRKGLPEGTCWRHKPGHKRRQEYNPRQIMTWYDSISKSIGGRWYLSGNGPQTAPVGSGRDPVSPVVGLTMDTAPKP